MTVSDTDPVRAKAIADEVANASSDYIGDIMEMVPPKIIEQGVVPAAPASPSIKKNAALGGLACIAAACGVITLKVIMNDTIRSEEDVGKYLGMSVLASVPDDDGMAKEQQRNRSKRKLERKKTQDREKQKGGIGVDEILHLKNTGRKDYFYEEAIKTLRTNIQFCGSGLKTIMFTSSMPDEGKKRDGDLPWHPPLET